MADMEAMDAMGDEMHDSRNSSNIDDQSNDNGHGGNHDMHMGNDDGSDHQGMGDDMGNNGDMNMGPMGGGMGMANENQGQGDMDMGMMDGGMQNDAFKFNRFPGPGPRGRGGFMGPRGPGGPRG